MLTYFKTIVYNNVYNMAQWLDRDMALHYYHNKVIKIVGACVIKHPTYIAYIDLILIDNCYPRSILVEHYEKVAYQNVRDVTQIWKQCVKWITI